MVEWLFNGVIKLLKERKKVFENILRLPKDNDVLTAEEDDVFLLSTIFVNDIT